MKLSFQAHCSDCCCVTLSGNGFYAESNGYVPRGLGIGGGDDVHLDIDLETGQILNWKKPSMSDIEKFLMDEDTKVVSGAEKVNPDWEEFNKGYNDE